MESTRAALTGTSAVGAAGAVARANATHRRARSIVKKELRDLGSRANSQPNAHRGLTCKSRPRRHPSLLTHTPTTCAKFTRTRRTMDCTRRQEVTELEDAPVAQRLSGAPAARSGQRRRAIPDGARSRGPRCARCASCSSVRIRGPIVVEPERSLSTSSIGRRSARGCRGSVRRRERMPAPWGPHLER